MDRLEAFVARRRQLAKRYDELLADLPLCTPKQDPSTNSSWHIYVVRMDKGSVKKSKQKIFEEMRERGVQLNLHYIPVHLQPYYQALGFKRGDFPASERYYEEAFTLPIYYELTDAEQDQVVSALREVLS